MCYHWYVLIYPIKIKRVDRIAGFYDTVKITTYLADHELYINLVLITFIKISFGEILFGISKFIVHSDN